jgi:hypothetical protein
MSAHGDMADVVEVMRHGAIDYLSKPWTPSELAAALARASAVVLPALSPIVAELRAVVADPAASVDQVAAVIARDPRTTVQVLKLANSAQYARNGRSAGHRRDPAQPRAIPPRARAECDPRVGRLEGRPTPGPREA